MTFYAVHSVSVPGTGGIENEKVLPLPGVDSTQMEPP